MRSRPINGTAPLCLLPPWAKGGRRAGPCARSRCPSTSILHLSAAQRQTHTPRWPAAQARDPVCVKITGKSRIRYRPGVSACQRSPPQGSARASTLVVVEVCPAAAGRVSACSKSEYSIGSVSTDAAYYINQFIIILFMIFPAKIMDIPRTAGRLLIV